MFWIQVYIPYSPQRGKYHYAKLLLSQRSSLAGLSQTAMEPSCLQMAWSPSRSYCRSSTLAGAPCMTCGISQLTWLPTEPAGTTTPRTSPSSCSLPPLMTTQSCLRRLSAGRNTWLDTEPAITKKFLCSCNLSDEEIYRLWYCSSLITYLSKILFFNFCWFNTSENMPLLLCVVFSTQIFVFCKIIWSWEFSRGYFSPDTLYSDIDFFFVRVNK